MVRASSPWYAFLYRLLGAHGTFWLWVVTIAALWWTWHGALVRLVDREPEVRPVSDAAETREARRWVVLPGVRLDLDPSVLGHESSVPVLGHSTILLDVDDPAASFWRRTRLLADVDAGPASPRRAVAMAALGDAALVLGAAVRADATDALMSRYSAVRQDPTAHLPRPRSSVLLLFDGPAPIVSAVPVPPIPPVNPNDSIAAYQYQLAFWREAVRSHVENLRPSGLLVDAPRGLVESLEKDPGVRLGTRALRVGRKPRDVELYVFGAAAIVFIFLAAGFYGVASRRPGNPDAGSA